MAAKPIRVSSVEQPDYFVIERSDSPDTVTVISRKEGAPGDCTVWPLEQYKKINAKAITRHEAYGILGVIVIPNAGTFLALISDVRSVGRIYNAEVFCIADTVLLPFASTLHLPALEVQAIEKSHQELRRWINAKAFYFSPECDITSNLQAQDAKRKLVETTPREQRWKHADKRFFWNRASLNYFIKNKLDALVLPVMKGFVGTYSTTVEGHRIELALIARFSCLHAGTRYAARGVDDDGNVGNYVETEQLVIENRNVSSFVQTRGSVPVFWEQRLVRGKYRTYLSRAREASAVAFRRHFEDQKARYGPQHIINLLSINEDNERPVLEEYEAQIRDANDPDLAYRLFDYHMNVGKSGQNYGQLGLLLLDPVQPELENCGVYCRIEAPGGAMIQQQQQQATPVSVSTQRRVFRTNCLDCLDRTNVVQTWLALRALVLQLKALGVLPPTHHTELHPNDYGERMLAEGHRQLWAANGDAISIGYTGTGAMKSSLLKAGKTTIMGMLDDGIKSALRTYNSMSTNDDAKQDLIDVFLGAGASGDAHHDELDEESIRGRVHEYTESEPLIVFVGTFNVNGKAPNASIASWLGNVEPSPRPPDLYVVGFQEIVGLTSANVWNADETNLRTWERQIIEAINTPTRKFCVLRSHQLVGLAVSVFVPVEEVPLYRHLEVRMAKVGFARLAGNKGSLAVHFQYHGSWFCFVCAHLAAGQNNVAERNKDYGDIMAGTEFRTSKGKMSIMDHDYVFFFGDFNYRISLDNQTVRSRVAAESWEFLYRADQLYNEMEAGRVFHNFSEAPPGFRPTYKFDPGTDVYDRSEKARTPAWCDRILFKLENGLRQYNYCSAPILISDHKPVSAVFQVTVKKIDEKKKEKILQRHASEQAFGQQQQQQQRQGPPATASSSSPLLIDDGDFFDPRAASVSRGLTQQQHQQQRQRQASVTSQSAAQLLDFASFGSDDWTVGPASSSGSADMINFAEFPPMDSTGIYTRPRSDSAGRGSSSSNAQQLLSATIETMRRNSIFDRGSTAGAPPPLPPRALPPGAGNGPNLTVSAPLPHRRGSVDAQRPAALSVSTSSHGHTRVHSASDALLPPGKPLPPAPLAPGSSGSGNSGNIVFDPHLAAPPSLPPKSGGASPVPPSPSLPQAFPPPLPPYPAGPSIGGSLQMASSSSSGSSGSGFVAPSLAPMPDRAPIIASFQPPTLPPRQGGAQGSQAAAFRSDSPAGGGMDSIDPFASLAVFSNAATSRTASPAHSGGQGSPTVGMHASTPMGSTTAAAPASAASSFNSSYYSSSATPYPSAYASVTSPAAAGNATPPSTHVNPFVQVPPANFGSFDAFQHQQARMFDSFDTFAPPVPANNPAGVPLPPPPQNRTRVKPTTTDSNFFDFS